MRSEAARDASNFDLGVIYKQHVLDQVSAMVVKNIAEIEVVYATAATLYEDMGQMTARLSLGQITQLRGRDGVCGFVTREGEVLMGGGRYVRYVVFQSFEYIPSTSLAL